jgi:hypothetical protein
MHVMYAFQEGENVTNHDHPSETPNPMQLHFSGPMVTSVTSSSGADVTVQFEHGEGTCAKRTLDLDTTW